MIRSWKKERKYDILKRVPRSRNTGGILEFSGRNLKSAEEKIHRKMILDKRIYSTKKLDNTMEHIINRINYNIEEAKRELTEEEKNEIIKQCYKEKFNV